MLAGTVEIRDWQELDARTTQGKTAKTARRDFPRRRAGRDRAAQARLAAPRAIAELEARADIDPLLDILNRRGFERELKRALAYVKRSAPTPR